MRNRIAVASLAFIAAAHLPAVVAHAQQPTLEVGDADTVKSVLERQAGKRVGVVLTTGQELSGVVTKVTSSLLHLSELAGREFSDAVVALDRISAVVIRTRSR